MMYDITAGEVMTPDGVGKFVGYKNGEVLVEMEQRHLVAYDGNDVFIF